jgi:hypothetical protein
MVISGTVSGKALGSLIFTVRICLASQGCPFVLVALVRHNVAASVRKPTTGRARREGQALTLDELVRQPHFSG